MFNKEERRKLWHYTGKGAIVGGILCVVLFAYEVLAGTWNCLCACMSDYDHMLPGIINSLLTFLYVFSICLIIGFIIGIFPAARIRSERVKKETNKRYIENHKEVLRQINGILNFSENTTKQINQPFTEVQYRERELQNEITELIRKCQEQQKQTSDILEQYKA